MQEFWPRSIMLPYPTMSRWWEQPPLLGWASSGSIRRPSSILSLCRIFAYHCLSWRAIFRADVTGRLMSVCLNVLTTNFLETKFLAPKVRNLGSLPKDTQKPYTTRKYATKRETKKENTNEALCVVRYLLLSRIVFYGFCLCSFNQTSTDCVSERVYSNYNYYWIVSYVSCR